MNQPNAKTMTASCDKLNKTTNTIRREKKREEKKRKESVSFPGTMLWCLLPDTVRSSFHTPPKSPHIHLSLNMNVERGRPVERERERERNEREARGSSGERTRIQRKDFSRVVLQQWVLIASEKYKKSVWCLEGLVGKEERRVVEQMKGAE